MKKYFLLLFALLLLSKCFAQPYIFKKLSPGHFRCLVHNNDGVGLLDTLTIELNKNNKFIFRGEFFESRWWVTGTWKQKNDTLILINDYPPDYLIPVKILPHRQVSNPYFPDIINKKGKPVHDFSIDAAIDSTNEPLMYTIQDTAARIRLVSGFCHLSSDWFRPPKDGGYQIMVDMDIDLKDYNDTFRAMYFLMREDTMEEIRIVE